MLQVCQINRQGKNGSEFVYHVINSFSKSHSIVKSSSACPRDSDRIEWSHSP